MEDMKNTPEKMNNFDQRPLLIYDGECKFCIAWANKFKIIAGDNVTFITLQDIPPDNKYVTRAACLQSVHFINTNNKVSKGAEAIFLLFYTANKAKFLFILYKWVPPFRFISELFYNWIAKNRRLFS